MRRGISSLAVIVPALVLAGAWSVGWAVATPAARTTSPGMPARALPARELPAREAAAPEAEALEAMARELTEREQAIHALHRLAFGPRPGDVERVMRIGVDRWIAQQLRPDRIRDPGAAQLAQSYRTLERSSDELLRDYPPAAVQLLRDRRRGDTVMTRADSVAQRRQAQRSREFVAELLSAKVARAVVSERQLQEVLTDFWENHFTVFAGKGQLRYYLPEYDRETIRPRVLGKFRDLLGAVAKSPAMLLYLDNAQSVADSGRPTLGAARRPGARLGIGIRRPVLVGQRMGRGADSVELARLEQLQQRRPRGLNENYARELLELHTLGVDGGYTQHDVVEVARALTGWSVNPPRAGRSGFRFRPEAHDAGAKVVLGHRLREGRGIEDGEEVLDIVARHPSTARHIARKLAIRFVGDEPPEELVDRAADAFTRTDGDIREVVRTLVTSPEFFSRAAYRSKIKSPFELTVSALRAMGAQADTTAFTAGLVARLGQPIWGHQAPNGWPETGSAWMNTGAILNRINFGLAVASGRLPGAPLAGWPPYISLSREPRARQVDAVVEEFLRGRVSPETREILVSGTNPLLARADADSLATLTPDDEPAMGGRRGRRGGAGGSNAPGRGAGRGGLGGATARVTGLAQVIGLAIGSPEFQRR